LSARLVLLATSTRTAPGLLSWEAWSTLRAADAVLVGAADHPLLPALAAADVVVEVSAYDGLDEHAAALLRREGLTVWVASPDGDPGLAGALARALDAGSGIDVDVVLGSWDLPGAHLLDLVAVMDRLRSPGGCPWDAEQTHESLVEYLVEEAYETVEAIETTDEPALREELGDLLLQVAFHARIAQEHDEPWGIDDVADGIVAKLVSRHPHVFADHDARTPAEVEANWKRLKAAEKQRASATDGIPQALPALVLAAKLLRRTADVPLPDGLGVDPAVAAAADRAWEATDGDVGDLLLALAARAHAADVDLEQALRESLRRYRDDVRTAEGLPG
jgi:XTP/dITP diphosphohydrolase